MFILLSANSFVLCAFMRPKLTVETYYYKSMVKSWTRCASIASGLQGTNWTAQALFQLTTFANRSVTMKRKKGAVSSWCQAVCGSWTWSWMTIIDMLEGPWVGKTYCNRSKVCTCNCLNSHVCEWLKQHTGLRKTYDECALLLWLCLHILPQEWMLWLTRSAQRALTPCAVRCDI